MTRSKCNELGNLNKAEMQLINGLETGCGIKSSRWIAQGLVDCGKRRVRGEIHLDLRAFVGLMHDKTMYLLYLCSAQPKESRIWLEFVLYFCEKSLTALWKVHNPDVSVCNGMQSFSLHNDLFLERLLFVQHETYGNPTCSLLKESKCCRHQRNLIGHRLARHLF